jgi:hypothetical protein
MLKIVGCFIYFLKLAAPSAPQNYWKFFSQNAVIKVRIGRPISVAEQNEYKTIGAYSEFLRKKTYMLANPT